MSYTCPHCGATSQHPEDIANRYCARCHHYCVDVDQPRCQDPHCENFGDLNFGEGTCPAEHAVPIGSPLFRAQMWHSTDHGGDPILGSCFCCCTACDPKWSARPNPFWAPAVPMLPQEGHR